MTLKQLHIVFTEIVAKHFASTITRAVPKTFLLLLICFSTGAFRAQEQVAQFDQDNQEITSPIENGLDSTILTEEESFEEFYFEEESEERQPEPLNETPVWSDEKWKEAIEETRYERDPPKEKKQEETETESYEEENYTEQTDISEWLRDVFLSDLAKIICIVLVVIMLTMLILYLTKARMKSEKIKLTEQVGELNDLNEEHIPETDLERYLRLALEKSDFKTSVRVLYLMTIQQLNSLSLIEWKKDKTNSDYLREMRQQNHYREFKQLTLLYEVVWYGERSVNATEFATVRKSFDQYQRQLKPLHEA